MNIIHALSRWSLLLDAYPTNASFDVNACKCDLICSPNETSNSCRTYQTFIIKKGFSEGNEKEVVHRTAIK